MTAELADLLAHHPELGPLLAGQSEADRKAESDASDERTRRAIFDDDWAPYWNSLRSQGSIYAQGSISFSTWFELISVFRTAMSKRFAVAFVDDTDRLVRCIEAFDALTNQALSVLGETYLAAKQKLIEEAAVARATAEGANAAKDEFLSRMSHELRTPLNAVVGFGQVLSRGDLSEDQRESVDQILKAGKMLLELINEVLDVSRIATGKMSLSPEPVSVREAMTEAAELLRPLAAAESVTLTVQDTNGLYVKADRQRLKQVLVNLIANAIKYNRPAGSVTVSWKEGESGRILLQVSDTGLGISPARMARLFSPFERLGAEATDVEGTGLGLALSKGLVDAMGGTLTATSVVSEGSVFSVDLALSDAPQTRNGNRHAHEDGAKAAEYTLLYVEDNISNLRLVQRILQERPDVALMSAIQGRIGLTLALEHQPTAILLDLHLPDLSGEEVLEKLREQDKTSTIPVIVMSADASPGRIERLLEMGAIAFLTKPLDVEKFLTAVDAACAQEQAAHGVR
jgi:signal transduction histidine kinase/ActR/RegA family two-component response regulator